MNLATLPLAAALLTAPATLLAQASPEAAPPQSAGVGAAPADQNNDHEIAKQLSNPVASLISVPFQENLDFGLGPHGEGVKSTLNIQPVLPVALSPNLNVIIRTILPVINQTAYQGPGSGAFGLGDTTQSFFFAPKSSGIIWAVGPAFLYPTATDHDTGGDKWGAGPTALVLKQAGKNTIGFLANHIWSVAGNEQRPDISTTFIQPFYSHTTLGATTYGINAEASYDWKHDSWVVPINVTVQQLTKMGNQRVQFGLGGRYYLESPSGGPDWGLRLIFTLLFPK